MKLRVQFEDEADVEYRLAGRWYEAGREHLGFEFFDAVDEAIDRIVDLPRSGSPVPRLPTDPPISSTHDQRRMGQDLKATGGLRLLE